MSQKLEVEKLKVVPKYIDSTIDEGFLQVLAQNPGLGDSPSLQFKDVRGKFVTSEFTPPPPIPHSEGGQHNSQAYAEFKEQMTVPFPRNHHKFDSQGSSKSEILSSKFPQTPLAIDTDLNALQPYLLPSGVSHGIFGSRGQKSDVSTITKEISSWGRQHEKLHPTVEGFTVDQSGLFPPLVQEDPGYVDYYSVYQQASNFLPQAHQVLHPRESENHSFTTMDIQTDLYEQLNSSEMQNLLPGPLQLPIQNSAAGTSPGQSVEPHIPIHNRTPSTSGIKSSKPSLSDQVRTPRGSSIPYPDPAQPATVARLSHRPSQSSMTTVSPDRDFYPDQDMDPREHIQPSGALLRQQIQHEQQPYQPNPRASQHHHQDHPASDEQQDHYHGRHVQNDQRPQQTQAQTQQHSRRQSSLSTHNHHQDHEPTDVHHEQRPQQQQYVSTPNDRRIEPFHCSPLLDMSLLSEGKHPDWTQPQHADAAQPREGLEHHGPDNQLMLELQRQQLRQLDCDVWSSSSRSGYDDQLLDRGSRKGYWIRQSDHFPENQRARYQHGQKESSEAVQQELQTQTLQMSVLQEPNFNRLGSRGKIANPAKLAIQSHRNTRPQLSDSAAITRSQPRLQENSQDPRIDLSGIPETQEEDQEAKSLVVSNMGKLDEDHRLSADTQVHALSWLESAEIALLEAKRMSLCVQDISQCDSTSKMQLEEL